MQKVDRLGWAAGFAFTAYGVLIGVRSNDPDALRDLEERLPFGSVLSEEGEVDFVYSIVRAKDDPRRGTRRFHLIYADAARIGRSLDWSQILDGFEKDVELFVGERAKGRVFVHAGAVEWAGRAILLPGPSLSGKSTLVAELVRAGARYCSDEFAILDENGYVHPFPRPIALRPIGRPDTGKYTPRDLAPVPAPAPVPAGCLLLTSYRAASRFRPQLLSPGIACLEVLRNTLCARTQPELVLAVLKAVTERAPAYRSLRGDARRIASEVLALVA